MVFRFTALLRYAVICVLLFANSQADAETYGMVEDGWEERVREGIFKIANTDFEEGLAIFEEYIEEFPDNPGGYFYYAAGVHEKIQKLLDFRELKRFYKYAKKCQKLSRKRLRSNPNDSVARIFLGATDGYIGLLEARRRHLVRAFKNGVETKLHLERAIKERPDIPDTYFGLGMLYYFSSRKAEEEGGIVSWVIRKFITHGEDMRQAAIEMLQHVVKAGALSKDYAKSSLMWIYLYEHNYEKAKILAYELANEFTRDTLSRWVLGRVALVEERCDEAGHWFGRVMEINELLETPEGLFEEIPIAMKKAGICARIGAKEYEEAFTLNEEVLSWLNGSPKVILEYQDEKNLIKFWKDEGEWTRKKLKQLMRRN